MTVNESVSAGAGVYAPVPAEYTSVPGAQRSPANYQATYPTNYWAAPLAQVPGLDSAVLQIPGSKSQTNRALLLAALSTCPSQIAGPLWARDTLLMKTALEQLGAKFTQISTDTVEVTPLTLETHSQPVTINCGLAGTVMRFLPVVAAAFNTPVTFTADPQANQRPLQPLLEVLASLGAQIEYHSEAVFPFTICGPLTHFPTEIEVDATASSQFFSALLLGLPWAYPPGRSVTIRSIFPPSTPHIQMTIAELAAYGIPSTLETQPTHLANKTKTLAVKLQTCRPFPVQQTRHIEVDTTTAMIFIASAAFTKAPVRVANWPTASWQPGVAFLNIMRQLGVVTYFEETANGTTTLVALPADLTCVPPSESFDLSDFGELTTVAVGLATIAPVPVTFTGIKHLRGHETDRLTALSTELAKLGIRCQLAEDSLTVYPPASSNVPSATTEANNLASTEAFSAQTPVVLRTYHDHRMAMFAALLGLKYPVLVENVETAAKTLPNFVQLWENLILGSPAGNHRSTLEPAENSKNTENYKNTENSRNTVTTEKGGSVEPA